MGSQFNKIRIMKGLKNLFYVFLLVLGGCFHTIRNDIPPSQIAQKSPERDSQARHYFQEAQRYLKRGKTERAFKQFKIIGSQYLETTIAPEAFFCWGQELRKLGKIEQAFEKFKFVTKNYVNYRNYGQVVEEEFDLACRIMQRYNRQSRLRFLSFFKDATEAVDCFQHIVTMAPHSEKAARALFLIAQLERDSGNKAKAIAALDQLIENYPAHSCVPDAYLLQGEIYFSFVNGPHNDQGMTRNAIHCYEDFLQIYSQDECLQDKIALARQKLQEMRAFYGESRLVLGDYFLYRRHYPEGALVFYNEAQLLAPFTKISEKAQKRIDFIHSGQETPSNWADFCFGQVVHRTPSAQVKR